MSSGGSHHAGMYIPHGIVKEIQRLVSVVCLDEACKEDYYPKRKDLLDRVFQLYHGERSGSTPSYIRMFFEGKDIFATMFETETMKIFTTNASAEQRTVTRCKIKVEYTQLYGRTVYVGSTRPDDITLNILMSKKKDGTGTLFAASTMYRQALDVLMNCKKAWMFALQYLQQPDLSLPPNTTKEDFYSYILAHMYTELTKNTNNKTVTLNEDDDDDDEPQHNAATTTPNQNRNSNSLVQQQYEESLEGLPYPRNWYFHGWMAFVLLGPLAEPHLQCELLRLGEIPRSKSQAKSLRDGTATLEMMNIEHPSSATKMPATTAGAAAASAASKVGMIDTNRILPSMPAEHYRVAKMLQLRLVTEDRQSDGTVFVLTKSLDNLSEQLRIAMQMATVICPQYDAQNVHWKRVLTLQSKCDGKRKELESYEAEKQIKRQCIRKDVDDFIHLFLAKSSSASTTTESSTTTREG